MQKRRPKKCVWFRDFGRCKFHKCSYKHVKKRTIKSDFDDISNKIIKAGRPNKGKRNRGNDTN